MRTQREIIAQCEARFAQIAAEAEKPERKWPCSTCKWQDDEFCLNPLIQGYGGRKWNWDKYTAYHAALCGPEKALWEERFWGAIPRGAWKYWPALLPIIAFPPMVFSFGFFPALLATLFIMCSMILVMLDESTTN